MRVNLSTYRNYIPTFSSTGRTKYYNSDKGMYIAPTYDVINMPKDGSIKIVTSNSTSFFRTDLEWETIGKKLENYEFPTADKVHTYVFGCSDGSEVYSLAIALIEQLGLEKAKKYFPICASDIDFEMIKQAKSGKIQATDTDIVRISHNIKSGKSSEYFRFRRIKQNLNELTMKDILRDNIIFSKKDILNGLDEVEQSNSLVLCRNFWRYLTPQQIANRLWKMREKLDESSRIIIGNYDKLHNSVPCFFENMGFYPVSFDYDYMNGNILKLYSEEAGKYYPDDKTEWLKYVKRNYPDYKFNYLY